VASNCGSIRAGLAPERMRADAGRNCEIFGHPFAQVQQCTAISTPVGPAPQIRHVSSFRCATASSLLGFFKGVEIRLRILVASGPISVPARGPPIPRDLKYPCSTGRQHECVVRIGGHRDHPRAAVVHRGDDARSTHSGIIAERGGTGVVISPRKGSRCDLIQQRVWNR